MANVAYASLNIMSMDVPKDVFFFQQVFEELFFENVSTDHVQILPTFHSF